VPSRTRLPATVGFGTRLRERRARIAAVACVLAIELLIALPFLFVSPSDARGVPGPLMIVVCLSAAFLLGPYLGVALTVVGVLLAVLIIGENPVSEPLVWIPVALVAGIVGDRVRRGEELRREVLDELRAGLVALSDAPVVGSLRVVSRYVPAETAQILAGDFYGIMPTPDGGVAIMVGDVSGHGPPAAAIATHLRAAWRAMAGAGVRPEAIMDMLNDRLVAEQRRPTVSVRFATVCLATVAPDNATVSLVVAGHPPPVLTAAGSAWEAPVEPQPAIGLHGTYTWRAQQVTLPAEPWAMVLYTDGLVEGQTAAGQRPFGIERLLPTLAARGPALEDEDVDALLSTVMLANGGALPDDVVVVAVSGAAGV